MLNDIQIRELAEKQNLIAPFSIGNLQPVSYDVHLRKELLLPESSPGEWKIFEIQTDYQIYTNDFILGATEEYVKIPQNIAGFICGCSSVARTGLCVESAGLIDPGFEGTLTLEITNFSPWPLTLKAGMRIAQLYFFNIEAPQIKKYNHIGHYNYQILPTAAKL